MSDNKTTLPLVSIGMPTYNRADSYLKVALKSALSQTYSNIEIIVSDNASTDNTEELVKSFNDPRIRYFKQSRNIGGQNNTNFCVEQARGDYFMQLHDDDMIDHDFIEACMKAAGYSADAGIIRTGTRVIDSDNNILQESRNSAGGLSAADFFRSWFAMKMSMYLCSTLFNTKELKAIGGFRSKHNLFDDVVTIARLIKFRRVDVAEIKASFRKHGNEETFSAKINDWCEDSLYLLDLICDVVPDESREAVRREGMQFLSFLNYKFAGAVKSRINRQWAYLVVYKMFGFKYLPPNMKNLLYGNPLYAGMRAVKKYVQSSH